MRALGRLEEKQKFYKDHPAILNSRRPTWKHSHLHNLAKFYDVITKLDEQLVFCAKCKTNTDTHSLMREFEALWKDTRYRADIKNKTPPNSTPADADGNTQTANTSAWQKGRDKFVELMDGFVSEIESDNRLRHAPSADDQTLKVGECHRGYIDSWHEFLQQLCNDLQQIKCRVNVWLLSCYMRTLSISSMLYTCATSCITIA